MIRFVLLIFLISYFIHSQAQTFSFGTLTDNRDGKEYKTVQIGSQTWMAENLAFRADSGCWAYNNDIRNVEIYGYLYNFYTAKSVCPSGWHLPEFDEWEVLFTFAGSKEVAGGKLKENDTTLWKGPNYMTTNEYYYRATNEFGFNARPGGERSCCFDRYYSIGQQGTWWTSTKSNVDETIWRFIMGYSIDDIYCTFETRDHGFSVRCLKD
jgi:uncharacterized protein (TIGR02145 family)